MAYRSFNRNRHIFNSQLQRGVINPELSEAQPLQWEPMIPGSKQWAISEAARRQEVYGMAHYAYWDASIGCYDVTSRMPLMGEWYDADGYQHGSR